MKNFHKLNIGDTFYVFNINGSIVDTYDRYGNVNYANFISEVKVENITTISEGVYGINHYSNGSYYLKLVGSEFYSVSIKKGDVFYISDEKALKGFIRNEVLRRIKEKDESIPKYIERMEKEKAELRKKFWDYLNN